LEIRDGEAVGTLSIVNAVVVTLDEREVLTAVTLVDDESRHRKSPRTSEIGGYSVGSPPVRQTGQRSVRGGSGSTISTPHESQTYDSPRIYHTSDKNLRSGRAGAKC
jgi:hypothetical protein